MSDQYDALDALTRLLGEDGPAWLQYFAPARQAPETFRRRVYRGAEHEPAATAVDVPVAIFHDVARAAGEHREVTVRLVDTPLERGRGQVTLAFPWPEGAFVGGAPRRVSCHLLVEGGVLDVDRDHATCERHDDGVCRLDLRLGADWVERDCRPDALLALLQGVLIVLDGDEVAVDQPLLER